MLILYHFIKTSHKLNDIFVIKLAVGTAALTLGI